MFSQHFVKLYNLYYCTLILKVFGVFEVACLQCINNLCSEITMACENSNESIKN